MFRISLMIALCLGFACKRPKVDKPMPPVSEEYALVQQLSSLQSDLALNKQEQGLVDEELKSLNGSNLVRDAAAEARILELEAELKRLKGLETSLNASILKLSTGK